MKGQKNEMINIQLREWKSNFIDVKSIMDDLIICRGKVKTIEIEVRSFYYDKCGFYSFYIVDIYLAC